MNICGYSNRLTLTAGCCPGAGGDDHAAAALQKQIGALGSAADALLLAYFAVSVFLAYQANPTPAEGMHYAMEAAASLVSICWARPGMSVLMASARCWCC